MSTDLSHAEVIDYVETLRRDYSVMTLERDDRVDLYSMRRIPKLPKDLARNEQVNILSPDVKHVSKGIRSFLLTFLTEIMCQPTARDEAGVVLDADKRRADSLEKAAAVFLAGINPNRELENNVIWSQLVEPCALIVFECGAIDELDPSKRFPWSAYTVPIEGTGWLEMDGIPTEFGRHYKQVVARVQRQYSRRRGTEYADRDLYYEDGKWSWKPASDSYRPTLARGPDGKGFREAEMMAYYDAECLYHVALNHEPGKRFQIGPAGFGRSSKRDGIIVWKDENPIGRVPVFIVPGNKTPLTMPEDKYEAFLDELLVTVEQLNVVSTLRATASRNRAAPRDYAHMSADEYRAWVAQNQGQAPGIEWMDGKTPVIPGELKERPLSVDPDLDKLEQRLEDRRARFTPASLDTLRDPTVVKQSNNATYLAALDSAVQFLAPLIGSLDTARRQMIEAWEASINYYAQHYGPKYADFVLTAGGDDYLRTQSLKSGAQMHITAKDLEFSHTWRVSTRSHTIGQMAANYEIAAQRFQPMPDGRPGVGIYEDLFSAIDESDPSERMTTMASEALQVETLDPLARQAAIERFARYVELESGVRLPLGAQPPPPAPGGAPGLNVQRAVPPTTTQVEGGSGQEI